MNFTEAQIEAYHAASHGQRRHLAAEWIINYDSLRGAMSRLGAREDVADAWPELRAEVGLNADKFDQVLNAVLNEAHSNELKTIVFGALGDSHLCNTHERLDINEELYDRFEEAGATMVFHTGNTIDGEARFNANEIHTTTMEGQLTYFAEKWPQRDGITTFFIHGDDHEGWYDQKGLNSGERLEDIARRRGRTDVRYLGYMEADVTFTPGGKDRMRIVHGGGGSAYALSHTSQKIVDAYHEDEKPRILLIGHYHKSHLLPYYRGVTVIQTGCTVEQSPFMRKKRLAADLGGWLVEVTVDAAGVVHRVNAEFIPFQPRKWQYRSVAMALIG